MGESKVEEKEKAIASVPGYKILTYRTAKGSFTLPKRMNFRKGSKRPWTPPLIFGKLCCKLFKLATKPSQVAGTLYFLKALGTAFFKMYLVLIFINTIVEKHNLKRPLCINFMVK